MTYIKLPYPFVYSTYVLTFLNIGEVLALLSLTYVPSDVNYDWHRNSFVLFGILTCLFIFFDRYVVYLGFDRLPKYVLVNYKEKNLLFHFYLLLAFCILLSYSVHIKYCPPQAYSLFSLFEYLLVFDYIAYQYYCFSSFKAVPLRRICSFFRFSGVASLAQPGYSYRVKGEVPYPPKSGFIEQRIDHFNFGSWAGNKFTQRYLYDDRFWDGNGPIFFYCGNEGSIESFWNNTGFVFEIAVSFKALVVFGEHRYYGESLPFGDPSLTFKQPYIQFLSIEQAMADYAYMIPEIQLIFKAENSPVIAFGGSYGGLLAAYMRAKYPHIVDGAIAASAPVYWTVGLKNIHGFFEDTTKNFDQADPKCAPAIKRAYDTILSKASTDTGLQEISTEMRLCSSLKSKSDLDLMLRWSRNAFVMMAMMDYPYPTEFMAPLPGNPVNVSCERAIKAGSDIGALREAVSVMYPYTTDLNSNQCFPYVDQYIPCADITGCGLGPDAWAWDFQSCTEIHLYDPSNHTSQDMFPDIPLTYEEVNQYCKTRWSVTRLDKQLATFFGPELWKQSSNIVFSNGRRDPWMNESVIAVVIDGGAHHLDLRESNPKDPESVKEARKLEILQITKWVNQAKGKKTAGSVLGNLQLKFQQAAVQEALRESAAAMQAN
ncbi:Dipeptidyl peptidase 2 [Cichlidogyrus casuarinus]|uniref:Dipeptidyl peptidase 2 n=1 Tax=Cichlidogyrus casuarinus TaxID=1844966 RepID=A0ABD2QJD4_9PLAT